MPQSTRLITIAYRLALSLLYVFAGASTFIVSVKAAAGTERVNVEVMIRQLNALEDTARRSAQINEDPNRRYLLDYKRLTEDITLVRQGLKNYLSPTRAQPRDPVELSGSYTTEGRQP